MRAIVSTFRKVSTETDQAQWHSPTSEGTTVHTLRKGDMLLIPRGAPHKRSTAGSVTFMLISVTSPLKG